MDYYVEKQRLSKDKAISKTSKLIYTTFKYHLVKYLGVFDLLYRFHYSQVYRKDFDNVIGIQILLQRLEYNALTNTGRKLSDFGVPFELVRYYDRVVENKTLICMRVMSMKKFKIYLSKRIKIRTLIIIMRFLFV